MTTPHVSVIIPTFNREHTICRAVDSVIRQSYNSIEIVVIDDGSTDATASRLAVYGDRIRFIRQSNGGPSKARNAGIQAARGSIIAFLDSDDEWLPDKMAQQVELLRRAGPEVPCVLSNCTMEMPDGTECTSFGLAGLEPKSAEGLWINVTEVLLQRYVLFNQVVAVRKEAFDEIGGFDESLRLVEDYDMALRLSRVGPWAYSTKAMARWYAGQANSLSAAAREVEVLRLNMGIIRRISKAEADLPPRLRRKFDAKYRSLSLRIWALAKASSAGTAQRAAGRAALILQRCMRRVSLSAFMRCPMRHTPFGSGRDDLADDACVIGVHERDIRGEGRVGD